MFTFAGSLGQLGCGLAKVLRSKFGRNNVLMSDILKAPKHIRDSGKLTQTACISGAVLSTPTDIYHLMQGSHGSVKTLKSLEFIFAPWALEIAWNFV